MDEIRQLRPVITYPLQDPYSYETHEEPECGATLQCCGSGCSGMIGRTTAEESADGMRDLVALGRVLGVHETAAVCDTPHRLVGDGVKIRRKMTGLAACGEGSNGPACTQVAIESDARLRFKACLIQTKGRPCQVVGFKSVLDQSVQRNLLFTLGLVEREDSCRFLPLIHTLNIDTRPVVSHVRHHR